MANRYRIHYTGSWARAAARSGAVMENPARILIVDDDKTNLDAARASCGSDFEFRLATLSGDALEELEGWNPAIVFLALDLPDDPRRELCSRMRAARARMPLQIVLMSATEHAESLDSILCTGADDFIRTPFEGLEFALRLKAATMRLAAQEQLVAEREFYRQAVRQEEELSSKLLDKQMNLRETLAVFTQKKRVVDTEDKRLAADARYDVLTGLLSRQSLASRIELEVRRAGTEDHPLCGIMVDLDRFKSVNDDYGTLAGDETLRSVGEAVRASLRKGDYAGRFGGEEFFAILPGARLDVALTVAERIRSRVEAGKIRHEGKTFQVTVSLGVAELKPREVPGEWVARADSAMYRSKQLGRNRVEA
ncbi:MAG TPA: diguanylate cyclase, partial [Spirochaetales bacterium]|nr:diguanylate cyclase [Spirochaetales bacterium]